MKKPARLGMGLSALMGDTQAPAAAPTAAPRTLPVEALEPSPFQARSTPDPAALAELAASIQEHGILQPILVRPKPGTAGKFQALLLRHRALAEAMAAGPERECMAWRGAGRAAVDAWAPAAAPRGNRGPGPAALHHLPPARHG